MNLHKLVRLFEGFTGCGVRLSKTDITIKQHGKHIFSSTTSSDIETKKILCKLLFQYVRRMLAVLRIQDALNKGEPSGELFSVALETGGWEDSEELAKAVGVSIAIEVKSANPYDGYLQSVSHMIKPEGSGYRPIPPSTEVLQKLKKEYIEELRWSIQLLADEIGVTRSALSKWFKRIS
jgi:hypothetical protein